MTDGFEVLVQDVIDAIATAPLASSNSRPSGIETGADFASSPGCE